VLGIIVQNMLTFLGSAISDRVVEAVLQVNVLLVPQVNRSANRRTHV
jgi:hypothetical protein